MEVGQQPLLREVRHVHDTGDVHGGVWKSGNRPTDTTVWPPRAAIVQASDGWLSYPAPRMAPKPWSRPSGDGRLARQHDSGARIAVAAAGQRVAGNERGAAGSCPVHGEGAADTRVVGGAADVEAGPGNRSGSVRQIRATKQGAESVAACLGSRSGRPLSSRGEVHRP